MTVNHVHGITPRVGRKKLWDENVNLTLPKGAKAEMDSVLEDGEDRLDLIRLAIATEVKRRRRQKPGKGAIDGSA